MIKNCFTVDLEDWFQGNEHVKMADSHRYEDRIKYSTQMLLDLLEQYQIKATFFVLGHVAEKKKSLIQKIANQGHEVASHGYSHELIYRQSPEEFKAETLKAKVICEDIVGKPLLGYRASNWTITEKSLWALDILKEAGFVYDSSIFPTKNYLFGIPDAPRFAHSLDNGLLEIPPSTLKWKHKTFPFSGGFFLRVLPSPVLEYSVRHLNREGKPAILYLHPWELDIEQPRNLPIPFKNQLIHYTGLKTTKRKLERLFSKFSFDRMDAVFQEELKCSQE